MGQLGFFDLNRCYEGLDEKSDLTFLRLSGHRIIKRLGTLPVRG